jgi:hypothetical protein
MKYFKMLGLCLVAAFACCASVVASASAETGPLFGFCDKATGGTLSAHCIEGQTNEGYVLKLLQSGETLTILASAIGNQKLETPVDGAEATIECEDLSVASGGYLEGGDPGTDHETLVYSNCSLPKNTHPPCDVNSVGQTVGSGIISTEPLTSELVYLTAAGRTNLNAAETGTLFKPVTSNVFVTIELTPLGAGKCPVTGKPKVTGTVVVENKEATVHKLLGVLKAEKAISKYFIGSMASPEEKKAKLEFGGTSSTYTGEASIEVHLLGSSTPLAFWICP